MSDYTQCASCPNDSRGEEYCPRCEEKMKYRDKRLELLGHEPPVTVRRESDRYQLIDKNEDIVVTIWCKLDGMADIVDGLAEYLSERGEEFLEEGAP